MSETSLEIRLFGDPILRKKTTPVREITDYHRQMLSGMARLMYAKSGVGLAASQVGLSESMIVADIGLGLYKLINPRITKKEGYYVMKEGCLSLPGLSIETKRAKKITVEAQDENAKPVNIEAEDLLACVFQHELDHLKGILIVDYASLFERLAIRRKLKKLNENKRTKNEELPESQPESCRLQL